MIYRKFTAAAALLFLLALSAAPLGAQVHPAVRIKDLADVEGVRSNQLIGLGIVTGLQGTGDKGAMATQMLRNLMSQFGVTVDDRAVKSKNAAVVNITADLPAFARPGQRIDVTVSAMGDAKSLQGGSLIQTPLKAADGAVYAVAQGPVVVGGFSAGGQGATAASCFETPISLLPTGWPGR